MFDHPLGVPKDLCKSQAIGKKMGSSGKLPSFSRGRVKPTLRNAPIQWKTNLEKILKKKRQLANACIRGKAVHTMHFSLGQPCPAQTPGEPVWDGICLTSGPERTEVNFQ